MSSHFVSFDGLTYTVSLFRPDATSVIKEYIFGKHNLSVCRAHKEDFQGRTLSPQIKGPPADDGFFYYLYAQPEAVGSPVFVWLKDKEEADALRNAIEDAEKLYYDYSQDRKCTFCGSMESECGGDHGDEMRMITRGYRRDL